MSISSYSMLCLPKSLLAREQSAHHRVVYIVIRAGLRFSVIATTLTGRTLTTFHEQRDYHWQSHTPATLETDRREEVEPGNIDADRDQGSLSAHRQGGADHRGQPGHRPLHRRGVRPPRRQGRDHRPQA